MEDFFKNYKALFLDNEESNFNLIIESIKLFRRELMGLFPTNSSVFTSDTVGHSFAPNIPLVGKHSKDVIADVVHAFENMIRWNHNNTFHNITPPTLIDNIAAGAVTNIYNPNCIWDYVSGNFFELEKSVATQVSGLVGFPKDSFGIFTFGGKGTLIYAIKLGLNRVNRNSINEGIDKNAVVITSMSNHYSIEYICNLLGLGKDACIKINTDKEGIIDLHHFELTLEKLLESGKKIGCIILSGGNSLNNSIDPIKKVKHILGKIRVKYELTYNPFIHVDSVIGWAWLVFNHYDFQKNPLKIEKTVLSKIKKVNRRISKMHIADSVGIDFHKNGFAAYSSSMYLCKNRKELYALNSIDLGTDVPKDYGYNFYQHFTIEHSRSGNGIISAYTSLQELGIDGFQRYIVQMMTINELIRKNIDVLEFEIINQYGLGFPVVIYPRITEAYYLLSNKPKDYLETIKHYCLKLFQFIASKKGEQSPILGYISNYTCSNEGVDIPALKIYPMSVNYTHESIINMLRELVTVKQEFDRSLNIHEVNADYERLNFPK
jgi:L-2,4-diaminobutyrate decarboxylase